MLFKQRIEDSVHTLARIATQPKSTTQLTDHGLYGILTIKGRNIIDTYIKVNFSAFPLTLGSRIINAIP